MHKLLLRELGVDLIHFRLPLVAFFLEGSLNIFGWISDIFKVFHCWDVSLFNLISCERHCRCILFLSLTWAVVVHICDAFPLNWACLLKDSQSNVVTLDVRLLQKLISCDPPSIIDIKKSWYHSLCIWGECLMVWPVVSSLDFLVKILLRDSSEWESTGEHHEKEHTQSPHINWLSIIFMLANDLRWHVAWCSTKDFESLVIGNYYRETKVYQFYHAGSLLNQDVV